ncbi:hypothetical protein V6N11_055350 [Hibiscus sabdariffa]|uniref:Uncharacterized protein n=1 Tax=Hibiscus sabdariffa TaxID=183260 RepID=A0ABR2PFG6_9ROSI
MLMVVSSSIVSRCILSHKSEEDGCSKFGELVRRVIKEHRALESHAEVTHKKDFVSIIMQFQKDGMFENLTQDNIKAILLDMFVAGSDTSSTVSEWMIAELLRHPNAMKKVQQEVRNVVGNNKSKVAPEDQVLNWEDTTSLRYHGLDQCLGYAQISQMVGKARRVHPREEGMLPAGEAAEKVDMTELYGLTVSMKTPLHALAIPRSSF